MYQAVSDEQIETEAKAGYKPLAIESGLTTLPLSELGDREFELLTYLLIKNEIENGGYPGFSNISLMQAVGERGRDCVLYLNNTVAGVVQCKKYVSRLSRPQVLKEIVKFLLFATLDKKILPDPGKFEYKLYVSNDFTEPAITLIYSYPSEIKKELESGSISKYIVELVEEYESFSGYRDNPPLAQIAALLEKIRVSSCNATDLTNRILRQEEILSNFFRVSTVISLEGADSVIRNALEDFGLKFLTDEDLKALQARIGNTTAENRVNLGWVDFFGFSREFFKYLKGDKFKEVMMAIAKLTTLLDREQINFLSYEIQRCILDKITSGLLGKGIIHPFSVGIAAPYLLKRLTPRIVTKSMPKSMLEKYYPEIALSKEQLIAEISEVLFDSSLRVMNGDCSHLAGSPDDIQFKLRIYAHMHQGFKNIDDAKITFNRDLKVIKPVLDEIELDISNRIYPERTVVIKDASFFDDEQQLKKMAGSIKVMDNP